MSRSVRRPTRPRETKTPRERIERALATSDRLHADEPPDTRVVIVRAGDLHAVMTDCPPTEESA